MQYLPIIQLSVIRRKEHEARRNLARLPEPPQLRLSAKVLHLLRRPRRRLDRRVHGARGYRIYPDAARQKLLREGARKGDYGALCRRVVCHCCGASEGDGGCGVDDAGGRGVLVPVPLGRDELGSEVCLTWSPPSCGEGSTL